MESFRDLMPGEAFDIIQNQIVTVIDAPGQALGVGIIISLTIAVFSAGAGIRAMMRAMNIAYEEIEKRNFFFFLFYGSMMTLGSFVLIWLSLAVIVGVPALLHFLNLNQSAENAARLLPWLLLIVVFAFAVGVMYRFGPSRRPARKRWVFPGIAFATFSWLFISYDATYGSLSAVVILLVWLWLTANVVIIGAEFNSELERQTLCDTTRGPERALGRRGAFMADFKARDTSTREAKAEIISPKETKAPF